MAATQGTENILRDSALSSLITEFDEHPHVAVLTGICGRVVPVCEPPQLEYPIDVAYVQNALALLRAPE